MTRARRPHPAALAAALLIGLALPALAEETPDPDGLAIGARLFADHCAACHGTEARGDGPLAPLLTVPTPDLRGLAARNDGTFPMRAVVHTIDGRTGRAAHGGPMPIWGAVFRETGGMQMGLYGSPLESRGRIMALTLWLESIQD